MWADNAVWLSAGGAHGGVGRLTVTSVKGFGILARKSITNDVQWSLQGWCDCPFRLSSSHRVTEYKAAHGPSSFPTPTDSVLVTPGINQALGFVSVAI